MLTEIKLMPVEAWLKAIPRSPQSRGHIRNHGYPNVELRFRCN
jgi:hypothetical protein